MEFDVLNFRPFAKMWTLTRRLFAGKDANYGKFQSTDHLLMSNGLKLSSVESISLEVCVVFISFDIFVVEVILSVFILSNGPY